MKSAGRASTARSCRGTALANSRPTGLILWTIGPAKNRRVNISTLVQMNASRAFVPLFSTCSVMFVIQLSVPSSTYPTRACIRYRNARIQLPEGELRHARRRRARPPARRPADPLGGSDAPAVSSRTGRARWQQFGERQPDQRRAEREPEHPDRLHHLRHRDAGRLRLRLRERPAEHHQPVDQHRDQEHAELELPPDRPRRAARSRA